ncbi:hypothetical protein ACFYYY_24920 [Streptomyces sp. NPDC001834]|uniref:hypothetical protein n=1 Tax=unclassified Streptomyces TaxID=2593676 RepID=UPI0036C3B8C9
MRIEDDQVITPYGARLMSSMPPRTADGIEKGPAALMDGRPGGTAPAVEGRAADGPRTPQTCGR